MSNDPGATARMLAWRVQENDPGITRPAQDAGQQSGLHNFDLGAFTHVVHGRIVDTTALAHCYKVQVEKGSPTITAAPLGMTSFSALGVRQLNTYQPGTNVWMIMHRRHPFGLIIGAEPPYMLDARRSLVDQISLASRVRVDDGHFFPLTMEDNGGITDWTAGRPFDGTTVGEAGWQSETGIRIFIDSFMAMLGVDEGCGITAFYHDQLLRICGCNLEFYTSGSERRALNDQLEYNDFEFFTPYPWEHMGMFENEDPIIERDAKATQVDEPWYTKYEPKEDDQLPFHRIQNYRGYLGQGGKTIIVAPPLNKQSPNRYEPETQFPGVGESQWALSGRYGLRTAKSITLSKRMLIPTPKRLKRPEHPEGQGGDDALNYKFSGEEGEGPEHKVSGEIEADDDDNGQLVRATAILDMHAYLFNWEGLHPFHYHENDWFLPEESELDWATTNQEIPDFSQLSGSQYLDLPAPVELEIDHRYEKVKYWPNESFISMLEDGGIVIGDGSGSEIRMVGGSVFISAPGDVWLKSGRNTNVWAGFDAIIRAKNSVDVTCTDKDVRIKAEKNMQLLAGNDTQGTGGILLESRAPAPIYDFALTGEEARTSGILLKAENSEVVNWASNIYLRTLGTQGFGAIVLDADRGDGDIVTHSNFVHHYVRQGLFHNFGQDDNIDVANEFTRGITTIGTSMCLNGSLVSTGALIARQTIFSSEGHIATREAESFPFVAPLKGRPLTEIQDTIADCVERATQTLPSATGLLFGNLLDDLFYDDDRAGNDELIEQAGFSLRKADQYKTEEFLVFEDRWQQMARLGAVSPPKWEEKGVITGSEENFPYPGKEAFEGGDAYAEVDLKLYDLSQGQSEDRPGPYEDPTFETPEKKDLQQYTVVIG